MANTTGINKNKNTKKKPEKKSNKKNPILKAFKIFFISLLCIIVLGSVAGLGVTLAIIKTAPALDVNGTILNLDQPSVLYDDKSQIMDTIITTQKRTIVHMDSVPTNLSNAIISIEDERFYSHNGIDIKRIIGAMFINVKNKVLRESSNIQGASTITQELIKQRMFLTDSLQNRISWKRKIQEAYLATELEKQLTKTQILEAYINTIYLGGQANGVQAAAKQYFNKDVKDLNLIECAFIAGLPQSPSAYYPFSSAAKKNPSIYINRTKTVLQQMHTNNYINDTDYSNALKDLDEGKLTSAFQQTTTNSTYAYQWFSSAAVDQVKDDLKKQYNYTDEQVNNLISDGGLKIYTTMDRNLQDSAQNILNSDSSFGIKSRTDSRGIIEPQAAATLVNYRTGEVKALVGGRGTQPIGSYNRAYGSFNQATGSSIKPLTVYSPAIEQKLITPATIVDDSPLSASISKKYGGYQPHNDNNSYGGPTTIRDAIKRSVNVIAVKVEDQLGISTGAAYAEKFGLQINSVDKSSIAALALGQLNHGSNTTTMAAAYGTFGNSGLYISPRLYTKVVDKNGNNVLENSASPRKVISPQTAYIMYDLLKSPLTPGGTATAANIGDMPAAGKTGTSTDFRNLWFCGLTPYYSGAVWIGNDNQSEVGAYSSTSARVWGLIMKEATKNLPVKDLERPEGIEDYNINSSDGKLMNNGGYSELFIDGTAPTEYSNSNNQQNQKNDVNTPVDNNSNNTTNTTSNINTTNNTTGNTNTTNSQQHTTSNETTTNKQNTTNETSSSNKTTNQQTTSTNSVNTNNSNTTNKNSSITDKNTANH